MSADVLLGFAVFAFVSSVTPGPNNTMLLASGVNFGFRRSVPHLAGVSLGVPAMLVLVGLGLGRVFAAVPSLYVILRIVGAAYLVWLAWKIARSGPVAEGAPGSRPLTFLQAAAFQWVNPKAWVLVVGAVSAYAPREGFAVNVGILAALLCVINAPTLCLWVGGGTVLRPWLARPGAPGAGAGVQCHDGGAVGSLAAAGSPPLGPEPA